MTEQGRTAPSSRAVRRMRDRLVRGGISLDAAEAAEFAGTLALPADRPAMLAAARSLAGAMAARYRRCTPDLLLEAAAALRGHRDWNTLSASLPAAPPPSGSVLPGLPLRDEAVATRLSGPPSFSTFSGEAEVWLVHHVHHRGPFPLATGPFRDLAAGEEELDGYASLHDSHSYRLVHWTGPGRLLAEAARIFRPGALLQAAERGEGRVEILRERSGAAETRGESYVRVLASALAESGATAAGLHRTAHPALGPLVVRLRACTCVDEASAALSLAADRQQEAAERLRPSPGVLPADGYHQACVLMGALRTAAAHVWRLDSAELSQDAARKPG